MTPRQLLRIVVSSLTFSFALSAVAAPRDAATLKKIDEALNVHYIAAEYDKAINVLQAAIKGCGTKFCSGEVLAKGYVALGVIRGNAKQDIAGAHTAFENAKAADPNATLDASLATPKVVAEFYKVMEREPPPEALKAQQESASDTNPALADTKGPAAPPRVSPAGDLRCTPVSGYEIQTARPIAVVCEPLEGVVRAELYYRMAGEGDYTAMLMSIQDGTLRAQIPCEATAKLGKLEVYVIAQDFNKEMIDTFGNIVTPAHYNLVKETKQAAPTYPGQSAPKRCEELLRGVAAEGEACSSKSPCKHSLYCADDGFCHKAPSCEISTDCDSRVCSNGFCEMDQDLEEPEVAPKRFMVGIHGALDVWLAPAAKQICGDTSVLEGTYNCYNSGDDKIYKNQPLGGNNTLPIADEGSAGNVDAGIRPATIRLLLSADYAFTPHLSAGVRVGWAFNGGPRTIHYASNTDITQRKKFFPVHAELRGTYWLRSLGKVGFRPYVHVGVGAAEVDAKIPIKVKLAGVNRELDAWRKLGLMFVTAGGGVVYALNMQHGVQLNLNAMYMLPSTGIVLEPSLGYVMAF